MGLIRVEKYRKFQMNVYVKSKQTLNCIPLKWKRNFNFESSQYKISITLTSKYAIKKEKTEDSWKSYLIPKYNVQQVIRYINTINNNNINNVTSTNSEKIVTEILHSQYVTHLGNH